MLPRPVFSGAKFKIPRLRPQIKFDILFFVNRTWKKEYLMNLLQNGKEICIYNMHTHIFPDKVVDRAVNAIGDFYGIGMSKSGTSQDLIDDGQRFGVKKYLVCSTATKANQVESINSFIAKEASLHPEFVGFGSLVPDFCDIESEVERIIFLGLKGIKLHPDFQKFNIDDPNAFKIYEAVQGRLPILFHTGDNRYEYSRPKRLLNVLEKFPKLVAIGAHLGGYSQWDEAQSTFLDDIPYLSHPRLYIDTSSSLMFLPPQMATKIIKKHGVDKVFFGTDYPMWNHEEEFALFSKLELSDLEREKILYKNAHDFLGI